MGAALSLSMPTSPPDLEHHISSFGGEIFDAIGDHVPPTFSKRAWSSRLMEWSMKRPEFKLQMFRLVDVLPTLKSYTSIMEHVREYLAEPLHSMHPLLGTLAKLPSRGPQAMLGAQIVRKSVKEMAQQFIAGEDAPDAMRRLRRLRKEKLAFTVDLLGEFAVSESESLGYLERYMEALDALSSTVPQWPESDPIVAGHPGEKSAVCMSIKLSALYAHTSPLNFQRSVEVLEERLARIARKAKSVDASLYVDAEDSANNPILYQAFKRVFMLPDLRQVPYPGIVVQAYAKGAESLLEDLLAYARGRGTPIAVRLVKGAYVDYENTVAAQAGLASPLFRNKESADANFEKLARVLLDNRKDCLPAFGSHNVRSLSAACCYAESIGAKKNEFELQMLYGMAHPIACAFAERGYLVRMYVPLGKMLPGMGYLVRRLLENTSNESFLRHTFVDRDDVTALLAAPQHRG